MSGITAGLAITGAVVGAGTSIASGVMAKNGAEAQAKAAEKSSDAAIAEQRRQSEQARADLAPWRNVGSGAIYHLAYLMGMPGYENYANGVPKSTAAASPKPGTTSTGSTNRFMQRPGFEDGRAGMRDDLINQHIPSGNRFTNTPGTAAPLPSPTPGPEFGALDRDFTMADFEKDPAYQTRLDEGYKGIERLSASRGGLNSGATGKALVRFGSDYAANEIDRSRTRFRENQTNRFNRWGSLANGGQQTSLALADLGQRTATNIGDLTIGGMTSAAAARAGGNAALAQGIGGAGNSFMNWYYLNKLNQSPSAAPQPSYSDPYTDKYMADLGYNG